LSALSAQAVPAFASLLAGAAYQDKPDEAQPRPNNGTGQTHLRFLYIIVQENLIYTSFSEQNNLSSRMEAPKNLITSLFGNG
jgi:hypothetical protein